MDKKKKSFNHVTEDGSADKRIPENIYPVLGTDLARDNIENDLPAADLEDL